MSNNKISMAGVKKPEVYCAYRNDDFRPPIGAKFSKNEQMVDPMPESSYCYDYDETSTYILAVEKRLAELTAALSQYADDHNWCYDTCNIGRDVAKNALFKEGYDHE